MDPPNRRPIRKTQRAPQSCISCTRRRVRCEKKIPCKQCVDRGEAATCQREVVLVKGHVRSDLAPQKTAPSYHELLLQNRRLKSAFFRYQGGEAIGSASPDAQDAAEDEGFVELDHVPEMYEVALFRPLQRKLAGAQNTRVRSPADIKMCSAACSDELLKYAGSFVYWIHFAVFRPKFEAEVAAFWDPKGANGDLSSQHPSWLAIYFAYIASSLLLMENKIAKEIGLPSDDAPGLVQNWYETSLYYLNEADFLRVHDVRNVQAIVILNILFNNVGDGPLYPTIWAATIRIAQTLKLNQDSENVGETLIEQQLRRRMWWTIAICEWLPMPNRTPCITESDCDCALPAYLDDDELQEKSLAPGGASSMSVAPIKPRGCPRPIAYHNAISRIAVVFQRFRRLLNLGPWRREEVLELLHRSDEDLAVLISEQPPHLDPDQDPAVYDTAESRQNHPWIRGQRRDLVRVLLYRRIAINRIVQTAWNKDPVAFAGPRAVCISSARSLIQSIMQSEVPMERRRTSSFTTSLFSAAIPLILEAQHCSPAEREQYLSTVRSAIEIFIALDTFSFIGQRAAEFLDELVERVKRGARVDK